jgi:hypothetical protein
VGDGYPDQDHAQPGPLILQPDFVMLVAAGRLVAGGGRCGCGLGVVVAEVYGNDR